MSGESDEFPSLASLKERWGSFLARIEGTFDETLSGAEPVLLDLVVPAKEGGLGPFTNAWTGVRGQLMSLVDKVHRTWEGGVRPQMIMAATLETEGTKQDRYDVLDEVAESVRGSDMTDKLLHRLERAGIVLEGKAALRVLEIASRSSESKLRCKECDADLEVEEMPYRAQYVPCEFCGRRNTYEPSTDLRQVVHFAADHLARYRALDEWDALAAANEDYRHARSPVPEAITLARSSANRTYHERVLRERMEVRPELEATYEQDLRARLDSLS